MTSDPLTSAVSDRISQHMNQEHSEALLSIAKHYGGLDNPKVATMLSISSNSIVLKADEIELEIPLLKRICNSEEAHQTLVKMLKEIPGKS